jgi:hypothetical protein
MMNSLSAQMTREKVSKAEKQLLEICSWNCVVYDWGEFDFFFVISQVLEMMKNR